MIEELDSTIGLSRLDMWYTNNRPTLPADADHYMLLTRSEIKGYGGGDVAALTHRHIVKSLVKNTALPVKGCSGC